MSMGKRIITAMVVALALMSIGMGWASDLNAYVNRADGSFGWVKQAQVNTRLGSKTILNMTSQTWQGIQWKHKIEIIQPAKSDYPDTVLLFITGNYHEGGTESQLATQLALTSRCPVAVLYDIPNQPLFGGKTEDALIAYSLVQYIKTGDRTWPLLLPMTKSAVRAMDTVQEFFKRSGTQVTGFVVCGGSKRGWTTWLTASVDPSRVKGIMPMVYDNLNLKLQMKQQIISFGAYSEQIGDYTSAGLQKILGTGKDVSGVIDPWSYRQALTMPKLLINGSNDPYWPLDALNIYWNDLKGSKSVLYMPNSGHGLVNNDPDGTKAKTLVDTMSSFTRSVASGSEVPRIGWNHSTSKGAHQLTIAADPSKYFVRMWVARSGSRDFRQSKWESTGMTATKTGFEGSVDLPKDGYQAIFGEATTSSADRSLTVSTQVAIMDKSGDVK